MIASLSYSLGNVKSKELSDVVRAIYETALHYNLVLVIYYVPSKENVADAPSRAFSTSDAMLSPQAWERLELLGGLWAFRLW